MHKKLMISTELDTAYKQMAEDEKREVEALEWAEALIIDVNIEQR